MSDLVSIEGDGAARARGALESCIGRGGVAIFPADTLYGLACDPLNAAAIGRLQRLKGRSAGKPSAVLYFSVLAMRELVAGLGPRTRDALGALLPGPVTVVIANPERRYRLACGDDPGRLGIRLIGGPLAGVETALLQTSANPRGAAAPHRLADVDSKLIEGVDLAVDGGEVLGEPSTVVDVSAIESGERWQVLREGSLPTSELDRRLAPIVPN